MSNTLGKIFTLTTFGESHGEAIGGIIDGCPANVKIDLEAVQKEMDRRKPGQSKIVTQRKEPDEVQFLSGIFEGKTTGSSIGFIIKNVHQRSNDYSHIKDSYRPSHADYTYDKKYGNRDYRGGGRTSARETANWVVGGAVAKQCIPSIKINAYTSSVGDLFLEKPYQNLDFNKTEDNIVRCPDQEMAAKMETYIKEVRGKGDTVGGIVSCVIKNVPVGRISLQITAMGYESQFLSNIVVESAKETILNIEATEAYEMLNQVTITATEEHGESINKMATVSAKTVTVEETGRYAGSLNDPARMVSSFAGVVGNAEGNNDIVVRGNSPRGILWRLEGIEIPNPAAPAN